MESRKYLVGMLFVALLIWGPFNHSWPFWFVIRIGYLIAIPVAAWFFLKWIWGILQPDKVLEEMVKRALGYITSGIFLILGILEAVADTHIGNTMYVRTHDGVEAVGDYIVMPGPDWGHVIMLIICAVFAFWFTKRKL